MHTILVIFIRVQIKSDVDILNDAGEHILFRTRANLLLLHLQKLI